MQAVMKPMHQTTKLANHFADPNEKVLSYQKPEKAAGFLRSVAERLSNRIE